MKKERKEKKTLQTHGSFGSRRLPPTHHLLPSKGCRPTPINTRTPIRTNTRTALLNPLPLPRTLLLWLPLLLLPLEGRPRGIGNEGSGLRRLRVSIRRGWRIGIGKFFLFFIFTHLGGATVCAWGEGSEGRGSWMGRGEREHGGGGKGREERAQLGRGLHS